jgi:hypothetical protein
MKNKDLEILAQAKIDYITKGYSIIQLKYIYNISQSKLNRVAKEDNWKAERVKYVNDTEIQRRKIFSLEQAKHQAQVDFMNRQERAKEFKKIIDEDIKKIQSGELKIKSRESLEDSAVNISKHIELLEGNPTDRSQVNFTEDESKEYDAIKNRLKSLHDTMPN